MVAHVGFGLARHSGARSRRKARVFGAELQLVERFLSAIKSFDTAHVPSVEEQILLNGHIKRTLRRETG
jgi:hypothetical protein